MTPIDDPSQPAARRRVFFERRELDQILSVYGRGVAEGDWRDYAMDALGDRAIFSIFKRASDAPLYMLEKRPDLARRQGAFALISSHGVVLKRGHELAQVLRFFDRKRFALVAD